MNILIYAMLTVGIIQMIVNIWKYTQFLRSLRDVLSAGRGRVRIWKYVALVLLIFFLLGYLLVTFKGKPDIIIAGILFGGSIFVAIMLTITFMLMSRTKERSIDIAEVLIGVIDARDPNLNGHSRHVQNLTMLLYEYIPSPKKKLINPVSLEYAALMHDVGKLGIPEIILNKPDKLTDEEWQVMKKHPEIGVKILEPLKSFRHVFPWILYHHEHIDGTGYHGLKGWRIPYASRIIAIADTYSAITMKRSYKEPRSHDEALAIMQSVAGTQLDSDLVEIFCNIPKNKVLACKPEKVDFDIGDIPDNIEKNNTPEA
ncbi:HD-GYP domain-containing protein [Ruminococcus flavefaciens]|uniref:HD-GYP domain-containing protein n=1 Tax=Ruminococcus flavefaciens TaxID=1265 RepID=UPI0026EC64F8|nr:HD domain-containing phosphohydrolase [Ruminococcus flavefaciens]